MTIKLSNIVGSGSTQSICSQVFAELPLQDFTVYTFAIDKEFIQSSPGGRSGGVAWFSWLSTTVFMSVSFAFSLSLSADSPVPVGHLLRSSGCCSVPSRKGSEKKTLDDKRKTIKHGHRHRRKGRCTTRRWKRLRPGLYGPLATGRRQDRAKRSLIKYSRTSGQSVEALCRIQR